MKRLREKGINSPIFPGIMPINNYGGFSRMTGFCKTRIPPALAEALKATKDDAAAFTELGLKTIENLCKRLIEGKLVPGLHFYCLNQYEKSYMILDRLGYLKKEVGRTCRVARTDTRPLHTRLLATLIDYCRSNQSAQ